MLLLSACITSYLVLLMTVVSFCNIFIQKCQLTFFVLTFSLSNFRCVYICIDHSFLTFQHYFRLDNSCTALPKQSCKFPKFFSSCNSISCEILKANLYNSNQQDLFSFSCLGHFYRSSFLQGQYQG